MKYQDILYRYVTTGIAAWAVLFNLLEIIYIKYSRRSEGNRIGMVYIVNMALSDLFVGVIMVVLKSIHPYMSTTFAGNEVAEEIYHIIRFCFIRFSLLVSVFNLSALTFDRLLAIRFPFSHQQQSKTFSLKMCAVVWVVAFILTFLFYSLARFQWHDSERYKDLIFPIATFPATILFIISYIAIFTVVKKSARTAAMNQVSHQRSGSLKRNLIEEREKIAFIKLALRTVAAFVICWLPLSIITLLKTSSTYFGQFPQVESSLFTLAFFNSLINPFIYFVHLQKAMGHMLCKMCTSRRQLRCSQPQVSDVNRSSLK